MSVFRNSSAIHKCEKHDLCTLQKNVCGNRRQLKATSWEIINLYSVLIAGQGHKVLYCHMSRNCNNYFWWNEENFRHRFHCNTLRKCLCSSNCWWMMHYGKEFRFIQVRSIWFVFSKGSNVLSWTKDRREIDQRRLHENTDSVSHDCIWDQHSQDASQRAGSCFMWHHLSLMVIFI